MRLDARRIAAFLRDPGDCRLALLYGDDAGLIRSRADVLVAAVAGRVDDPFRVTELDGASASDLQTAAASLSLTGGRPVVRVRHTTDAVADAARAVLAAPGSAFVVLEGTGLPSRSRLRQAVEAAERGAAIACYPLEGRDFAQSLQQAFTDRGLSVDREVVQWLSSEGDTDHSQLRQTAEVLALYAGRNGHIDLVTARDCLGAGSSLSLDDALFAATEGNVGACDRALVSALEGGQAGITIIRAAMSHLQRLLRVQQAMEAGAPPDRAVSSLRPPLFWRQQASFKRALQLLGTATLLRSLEKLLDAERLCKQTGIPAELVCRQAVTAIAVAASEGGRPRVTRPGAA